MLHGVQQLIDRNAGSEDFNHNSHDENQHAPTGTNSLAQRTTSATSTDSAWRLPLACMPGQTPRPSACRSRMRPAPGGATANRRAAGQQMGFLCRHSSHGCEFRIRCQTPSGLAARQRCLPLLKHTSTSIRSARERPPCSPSCRRSGLLFLLRWKPLL
jgi:hypothetical protein